MVQISALAAGFTVVCAIVGGAVGGVLIDEASTDHADTRQVVHTIPVAKQCPIVSAEQAQRLTRGGQLNSLANNFQCVFTDSASNTWLSFAWFTDPEGKAFDKNAYAIGCEPVKPFTQGKSCWGAKHNGIFFVKDGKLVFVHAPQARNDEDLVDITNGIASAF